MNCNSEWLQYHVSVPWFIINYDYSFSMNEHLLTSAHSAHMLTPAITVAHAGNPQAWTWCMTRIIWHFKICLIYIYMYIYNDIYIDIYCIVIVRKTCFALDLHMCSISVFAWLRDSVTLVPLRQEDGDELHHAVLRHQRCYLFVSSRLKILKWFRAPVVVIFWALFTNQPMLTDLTVTFQEDG